MQTSVGIKHDADRNVIFKSPDQWLEDKKNFDGAEDLWRIHDGLYDLTNFIDRHPGGRFWITTTKGLDITETFESHHLSIKPEALLPKYFIRKAQSIRNSPYTFHEDGFYRTLKRNIRAKWEKLPTEAAKESNFIMDALFIISFLLSAIATACSSYLIGILAGINMGFTLVAGHNYYHQKDNFRMYYNDVFMLSSRDFRIIHVFSHHALPNTVADLQTYLFEPLLQLHPIKKSPIVKYASLIYGPFVLWPLSFLAVYLKSLYDLTVLHNFNHKEKILLPWLLPLFLYLTTKQPLLKIFLMWIFIIAVNSQWFSLIGFATNHYHPEIFIDGDIPRSSEKDWGVSQLNTAGDKIGIVNTHFLGLIFLGDHALHHLFPFLDHGVLQQLYPIFIETMKKFDLDLRVLGKTEIVHGYFARLSQEVPNMNPQH